VSFDSLLNHALESLKNLYGKLEPLTRCRYLDKGKVELLLSSCIRRVPRLCLPSLASLLVLWGVARSGLIRPSDEAFALTGSPCLLADYPLGRTLRGRSLGEVLEFMIALFTKNDLGSGGGGIYQLVFRGETVQVGEWVACRRDRLRGEREQSAHKWGLSMLGEIMSVASRAVLCVGVGRDPLDDAVRDACQLHALLLGPAAPPPPRGPQLPPRLLPRAPVLDAPRECTVVTGPRVRVIIHRPRMIGRALRKALRKAADTISDEVRHRSLLCSQDLYVPFVVGLAMCDLETNAPDLLDALENPRYHSKPTPA
jgi:hypothetical protein